KIHLFWGDERCVHPEDEESNFGMTKKFLLDYIDIPEKNVHRIRGEENPEKEAIRYTNEIKKYVPFYKELPLFDLIMLGLGEDGHTASIFTNQKRLINSDKICEVAVHPVSGQKRITLTGTVINNAKRIIFLVTGGNKSGVIKELLEGKEKNKYPAAYINSIHGRTDYFMDKQAAKLLK
ncbi:MAG TPA: 6-phosphogluconolactonase, partial [Ignavibacteriaceae bacterium]|nr:6-phosphogluconolactonase [Ignavibacteriaceae bacterium]